MSYLGKRLLIVASAYVLLWAVFGLALLFIKEGW